MCVFLLQVQDYDRSSGIRAENVKKFLEALDALGIPGFQISDLEKVSIVHKLVVLHQVLVGLFTFIFLATSKHLELEVMNFVCFFGLITQMNLPICFLFFTLLSPFSLKLTLCCRDL